jgi:hypothetical protein
MAQLTIKNAFSQMVNFALLGAVPTAPLTERMTIHENQHFTLPNKVTSIRVRSGKAWISYLGKDIVLKAGETLEIESGRDIAIVTSLGYKPVELQLNQ